MRRLETCIGHRSVEMPAHREDILTSDANLPCMRLKYEEGWRC